MDPIVRTVSHKDGGEVTDAEENAHNGLRTRTPQRSSLVQQPPQVVATSTQDEGESNRSNLVVADKIPEEGIVEDDDDDEGGENNNDDEEDEEDGYEYEDDDDAAFSGFLVDNPSIAVATALENSNGDEPATIEEEEQQPAKLKWREPSKAAVDMSLRAEKETSGGKRRLAQDLYRIMNQDTEEAGFSLQPSQEDSMDKWTIQLFQFDEDSKLAKDMKVLGVSNIELEMSFPEHYPFEPPFVRVTRPRFRRQTGFVMNGALCMELLTKVRKKLFLQSRSRGSK
jgi:ubiquitin-protein ligase